MLDPDATLARIRVLRYTITTGIGDDATFRADAVALAEAIESLDESLSSNGHLPEAWEGGHSRAGDF